MTDKRNNALINMQTQETIMSSSSERQYTKTSAEGGIEFIRPSELANEGVTGVILEGRYEGTLANPRSGKNDFKFTKDDGSVAVINNTAHLAALMKSLNVQVGDYARVSYFGKEMYRDKESHKFQLDVASSDE